jgi:hypothetical protein
MVKDPEVKKMLKELRLDTEKWFDKMDMKLYGKKTYGYKPEKKKIVYYKIIEGKYAPETPKGKFGMRFSSYNDMRMAIKKEFKLKLKK